MLDIVLTEFCTDVCKLSTAEVTEEDSSRVFCTEMHHQPAGMG